MSGSRSLKFAAMFVAVTVAVLLIFSTGKSEAPETEAAAHPPTPSPTASPGIPSTVRAFVNDTGQVVNDLHVEVDLAGSVSLLANAPGCPVPSLPGSGPFPSFELVWSATCLDPGESVTLEIFSDCFAPLCGPPAVSSHFWTLDGTPVGTLTPTSTATPTPGPACPGAPSPPGGTCPPCPGFEALSVQSTCPPTATPAGDQLIWGDHNCSGSANPVDSLLTLRFDAGLGTNTGDCPALGTMVDVEFASPHLWGDIDCSGEVTPVDSLKILRYDAGLGVTQAEGCPGMGASVTIVEP